MTVRYAGVATLTDAGTPATTARAIGEAARPQTSSMNSGGTTHRAASNSPLGIVIAIPETMLHAPSVSMAVHHTAIERARAK